MSGLTVGSLHKIISKLVEEGHSRKPVSIDKSTFNHPLEEHGTTILRSYNVRLEPIAVMTDDGVIETGVDGTDNTRVTCIIEGFDYTED